MALGIRAFSSLTTRFLPVALATAGRGFPSLWESALRPASLSVIFNTRVLPPKKSKSPLPTLTRMNRMPFLIRALRVRVPLHSAIATPRHWRLTAAVFPCSGAFAGM